MENQIHHDQDQHRFVTPTGAVLTYIPHNGFYDFNHIEVPTSLRGSGVASQLAQHALEHARTHAWKIYPSCSYIAMYIKRHPEFSNLVYGDNQ